MSDLRLCYQTIEFGNIDIHVCTLRDRQEFHDPDGVAQSQGICSASWPMFGVIWPSSQILAQHMSKYQTESKRILEIGCGMALSTLFLNKLQRDVTATDYHPEAETFLQRNAELNADQPIAFEQVNWSDNNDELGLFDLIIGSDLLYEDEHVDLVASFIARHAQPHCEVVIVDPGRGRKNKLGKRMTELGFSANFFKPDSQDETFKGYILEFVR